MVDGPEPRIVNIRKIMSGGPVGSSATPGVESGRTPRGPVLIFHRPREECGQRRDNDALVNSRCSIKENNACRQRGPGISLPIKTPITGRLDAFQRPRESSKSPDIVPISRFIRLFFGSRGFPLIGGEIDGSRDQFGELLGAGNSGVGG